MKALPARAKLFWTATAILGLVVVLAAIINAAAEPIPWLAAAFLFLGGFASETLWIQFSYRRSRNTQIGSVASAFFVASLLLLTPALAVAVTSLSLLLTWVRVHRVWYKHLFNIAQYSLAVGLAGWVWHRSGSSPGLENGPQDLFWLVVALAVYFAVNTGLVSLMVALADGLPVRYVWLRSHRHILPAYFGMLFAGALIALLGSMSPWSVLMAMVPLVAIYYAFRRTIDLEQQTLSALFELADILDQRDYYTHQHSVRVGEESEKLALRLSVPSEEAHLIYLCGRLHDIGKCAINNEVLLKPGPLTTGEREHMCRHAQVGGQMLAHFNNFRVGSRYVRGHHEWYDGSGYPDGLKGERIPLGARIIAVADAYDAMTTNRPYRAALAEEEALRRIQEGRGTQWDPAIVDAYLELLAEHRPGAPSPQPERDPVASNLAGSRL